MEKPPRVPSSVSDSGSTSSTGSARSKASMTSMRVTNLYKATMNRFLTRKKTEAALEGGDAPPPPSSRKSRKNKKKQEEEPKPQLDLSQALPSTDNFRTSLLMPNLSARFSMLREQDDPESKMGKASDDSVLFSKRQSRLTDYGFNPAGLSDIAEVSSINGSIRPPFLAGRSGSVDYGDDGDSIHSGSIMSRSRPGESNVLFGGRQKVFLGNRALYEDDVGLSAYQRIRNEERRKKREEEEGDYEVEEENGEEPESPAHDLKHSSSFTGSLQRRETASSTTSAPGARASTAATSIASQGANAIGPPSTSAAQNLERTGTKGRRLYEQGLDRNAIESNSAINRLNSLQKQRTATGGRATPPLTQTRSATNLSDRFNRGPQYRPASPPPSAPLANMGSFKAAKEGDSQQSSPAIATSSPTSPFPPISPLDENNPLASAIQSGDRGKATAMGVFNKPAQRFDENQYMRRQKQMLQGRETPPPRKPSPSPSRGLQDRLSKFEMKSRESDVKPKQPPAVSKSVSEARKRLDALRADLDDFRPSSDEEDEPEKKVEERIGRSRSRTNSSGVAGPVSRVPASPPQPVTLPNPAPPPTQKLPPTPNQLPRQTPAPKPISVPKQESAPTPTPPEEMLPPEPASPEQPSKNSAFSVFQRAKQQMQATANVDSGQESPAKEQMTFFSSRNSSDDEDDEPVPEVQPLRSPVNRTFSSTGSKTQSPVALRSNQTSSTGTSPAIRSRPPVHEHPAMRSSPGLASQVSRASEYMLQALNSPNDSEGKSSISTMVKSDATDLDSPTLGPENGGLSGMIRQHLRNQSQHSGISSMYDNDQVEYDYNYHSKSTHLTANSMLSDTPAHSSYSHSNPWDLEDLDGGYYGEADSLSSASPTDGSRSKTQPFPIPGTSVEPLRSEPPRDQQLDHDHVAPWEQDMKSKHSRNISRATLAEREAFQRDLEERQKAIQEALKSKMEESRSGSPTPSMGGAMKAFGMLRAKSSKDTLASRTAPTSKGITMFGMGTNTSNPSLSRTSEEHLQKQRERLANSPMPSDDDYLRDFEERLTRGASSNPQSSKSRSPSVSRARSNSQMSGASGRSRSRAGRRESAEQMPPPIPSRSGVPTPDSMPSSTPVVDAPSNPPPRMRSGSKSTAPGYFDQKSLHPIQTGLSNGMSRGVSPVSAGAMPNEAVGGFLPPSRSATVALGGSRSAGHSPGVSPLPTKTTAAFAAHSNHSSPAIVGGGVPPGRKKSIAKSIISEPLFVSSTSVVDTIELPAGASLKNGMSSSAPPLPPINPMRRRFGFGRSDSSSTTASDGTRASTEENFDKRSRASGERKKSNAGLLGLTTTTTNDAAPAPAPVRPPPPPPPPPAAVAAEEGAMF